MSGVIVIFTNCFLAISSWFSRVLDATGMGPIYLASVFLFILFSRLLTPIFGAASSDFARRTARSMYNSKTGKGGKGGKNGKKGG